MYSSYVASCGRELFEQSTGIIALIAEAKDTEDRHIYRKRHFHRCGGTGRRRRNSNLL